MIMPHPKSAAVVYWCFSELGSESFKRRKLKRAKLSSSTRPLVSCEDSSDRESKTFTYENSKKS